MTGSSLSVEKNRGAWAHIDLEAEKRFAHACFGDLQPVAERLIENRLLNE